MKKILIVNNNMKVGGVQKSLYNLLWTLSDQYSITLLLFARTGEYLKELPANVEVAECRSLFRYLGISQGECRANWRDRLLRGGLAALCRLLGRPAAMKLILASQKPVPGEFDAAISFLHNGNPTSFYGGVNEFVLEKVCAGRKITFLHCDYQNCGADHPGNNGLYSRFDRIAACSDGCRQAFLNVLPDLASRCATVRNCHRYDQIIALAARDPVSYEPGPIHVLIVARLAPEKAVHRGIRAVSHCRSQGQNIVLHLVGGGKMRNVLEKEAEPLGNAVRFYGEQDNPYRFMKNADLLLITSYHEAAPMIIEEAMCLGLPTLTVKTTSSRELVTMRQAGWECENTQEGLNEALQGLCGGKIRLAEARQSLQHRSMDNQEALTQLAALLEGTL